MTKTKNNISCFSHYLDLLLWFILYLLPVFAYLITSFHLDISFGSFLTDSFGLIQNTFVYSTLSSIFGLDGLIPLVSTNVLIYLSYFVSLNLIHLAVDTLLFIPRLSHKFFDYLEDL